jgi:hypothetical protein
MLSYEYLAANNPKTAPLAPIAVTGLFTMKKIRFIDRFISTISVFLPSFEDETFQDMKSNNSPIITVVSSQSLLLRADEVCYILDDTLCMC